MKKLNILISTYGCAPNGGSESAVGWNTVINVAKYHNVTVLFPEIDYWNTNQKQLIDSYLSENDLPNKDRITFIAVKCPHIIRYMARIDKIFKYHLQLGLAIRLWHKAIYRYVKQTGLHKKMDVIHQLTPVNFTEQGYLWKLTDNFFCGPTGIDIKPLKKTFLKHLSLMGKITESVYGIFKFFRYYGSSNRKMRKKAKHIYVVDKDSLQILQKSGVCSVSLLPDTGTYKEMIHPHAVSNAKQGKLKIIWCGRICWRKQLNIFLEAIDDEFLKEHISATIIGKGELKQQFQRQYKHLDTCVEWLENIPYNTFFDILSSADVLVHTSFREGATAIILEGLSNGLPVICHDTGGMSLVVTENSGIKIPFISPEYSVDYLKKSLKRLVGDNELLINLKQGALRRAEELTWENRAKIIAESYEKYGN